MVPALSAIAAMFAIAFFVSIGHQAGWSFSQHVTDFIKDYQALIAGILGLIGGASAYFGIRKQVAENKKESEIENNKKKAFAYEEVYRNLTYKSGKVYFHKKVFTKSFFEKKKDEIIIYAIDKIQKEEKISIIEIPIDLYFYLDWEIIVYISEINVGISNINSRVVDIVYENSHNGVTEKTFELIEKVNDAAISIDKTINESIEYCASKKFDLMRVFHSDAPSAKRSIWQRLISFRKLSLS